MFIACYHPIIMEKLGYKVNKNGEVKLDMKPCKGMSVDLIDLDDPFQRYITVPCGQCVGCRLDYSRQWANRMMMELECHKSAYFVTLTYNDEHLPFSFASDPLTGEIVGDKVATLRKKDVQDFMKRVRKNQADRCEKRGLNPDDHRIRFYASGEYGEQSFRPHYHLIMFGLELDDDDKIFYKHSQKIKDRVHNYYLSPILEDAWVKELKDENGNQIYVDGKPAREKLGYVVISEVTWETCAYTARYVMKKLKGEQAETYSRLGIEPPFSLMSRKPGLGAHYLEQHPDMYDFNTIWISTPTGGKEIYPPKYIDSLFAEKFPYEFEEIHNIRASSARAKLKSELEQSSKSYSELLADKEFNTKQKIKSLRRNDNFEKTH